MLRIRYKRIFLLIFLLAFAGGAQQVFSAAAAIPNEQPAGKLSFSKHNLPHDELEKNQPSWWAGYQQHHPRPATSALELPAGNQPDYIALSLFIYNRQNELPVKDYLFHIYPSHHFW